MSQGVPLLPGFLDAQDMDLLAKKRQCDKPNAINLPFRAFRDGIYHPGDFGDDL